MLRVLRNAEMLKCWEYKFIWNAESTENGKNAKNIEIGKSARSAETSVNEYGEGAATHANLFMINQKSTQFTKNNDDVNRTV